VNINTYWGKIAVKGNTITLDADEKKAKGEGGDGIGSALTFMEWDGSARLLTVERTKFWRPEPWADLWFVARESAEANPWPMRYVRFRADEFDFGRSTEGNPEDQWIGMTWATGRYDHRVERYRVMWWGSVLHIEPDLAEGTYSMPAPVCELGLYVEGCVCEVTVE